MHASHDVPADGFTVAGLLPHLESCSEVVVRLSSDTCGHYDTDHCVVECGLDQRTPLGRMRLHLTWRVAEDGGDGVDFELPSLGAARVIAETLLLGVDRGVAGARPRLPSPRIGTLTMNAPDEAVRHPLRDRLLLAADVVERFPTKGGKPTVSERWVREHVAPRRAQRIGRHWAVRESVFNAWYGRFVTGTLAEDDITTRERNEKRERR